MTLLVPDVNEKPAKKTITFFLHPPSLPPPQPYLIPLSRSTSYFYMHCNENPLYVILFWELRGLSTYFHVPVSVSDFYSIFPGWDHIFSCSRIGRPILEIPNLSQIYEYRKWEAEHYNSVLEITVSFLGIHNWETDIYIGFSPALHLYMHTFNTTKK